MNRSGVKNLLKKDNYNRNEYFPIDTTLHTLN